ncbi:hypothetical protein EV379_1199 [Microterricola gilva]|uniref:Uncharacterized protein n=1 Tax=Microterricola gilva TaxID=393267 RepID=A0A4Q8AKG4_9MICO|nr:hypothetical protein [Microterricola gilva]RZU64888.1 hypothetical protein EV379_1199 [Microterricola gilva]
MTAEDSSAPIAPTVRGKRLVALAIVLILAQGVLTIALSFYILDRAYTFVDGCAVCSIDELYMLGDGPKLALASVWLTPLFGTLAGIFLLSSPLYRWAWLPPLMTMLVSIALCLYFISTFEYTPRTGG